MNNWQAGLKGYGKWGHTFWDQRAKPWSMYYRGLRELSALSWLQDISIKANSDMGQI